MQPFRKKIYIAAGYNTVYFGNGRKEFSGEKPNPPFESYLKEAAEGTKALVPNFNPDEGIIGSFMSGRFIKQANLSGFLPFMVPRLKGLPCVGVEGACGTGGRCLSVAVKSALSDLSNGIFVAAFEMQNTMKSVYGADVLAGAAYYKKERKQGHAYFFPGLFSERACAYYEKWGKEETRHAMAKWYELAILNARKNPKAQEYHNQASDLLSLGMTPPNPKRFVPYLNVFDCSKVTDGASSLMVYTKEGLEASGIALTDAVELIGMGLTQGDITTAPEDLTVLSTTQLAVNKALEQAKLTKEDISVLEVHDCFTISGLLSLEAIGFANPGKAPQFILEGHTSPKGFIPTNLSGGLIGFGHPTGATGVRQMVDLYEQLTGKAPNQVQPRTPYGMMISMGGNDKTVSCFIVKSCRF